MDKVMMGAMGVQGVRQNRTCLAVKNSLSWLA